MLQGARPSVRRARHIRRFCRSTSGWNLGVTRRAGTPQVLRHKRLHDAGRAAHPVLPVGRRQADCLALRSLPSMQTCRARPLAKGGAPEGTRHISDAVRLTPPKLALQC